MGDDEFLTALEVGTLPLAAFDHRAHLRAGYLYLRQGDFGTAIARFCGMLKAFAARHGKSGLYHETITVAFMALINERIAATEPGHSWQDFIAQNPDLLDRQSLARFYAPEELTAPEARRVFMLPRRRGTNRNQNESTA